MTRLGKYYACGVKKRKGSRKTPWVSDLSSPMNIHSPHLNGNAGRGQSYLKGGEC